jgi:endonuclease I
MKKYFLITVLLLVGSVYGQIPSGYYNNASGLTGSTLKTALCKIIKNHTTRSYAQLWTDFQTTDKTSTGNVWDMYSNCTFVFGTNQCGSYSVECDCYNREHSMPNSWWGGTTDTMYTDLFHLVPTDGKVNGTRSNYPFGEVTTPTNTTGNGSKLGPCSFAGYTGTVFEPVDEYKGDFARNYFYLATRYESRISSWSSDMLAGNSFPVFTTWAVNLLLKWHEQDPVSQKELDRNNAIYGIQHNRNPFIDHPEWAECIWATCTTGVENPELDKNFLNVYPNPAAGNVTVSYTLPFASVENIELFTIDGKLILRKDCSNVTENNISIATADIPDGIYFIKIITDHSAITKQLIIQKQQ